MSSRTELNRLYRIKRDRKALTEMADPADPRHGTRTGYVYGCRCERCREIVKAEWRAIRKWKRDTANHNTCAERGE